MIKIEARTLEEAYQNAASSLKCSVTELKIEVVQSPNKGFMGLFQKNAIIVAVKDVNSNTSSEEKKVTEKTESKESKAKNTESLDGEKVQKPRKSDTKKVKTVEAKKDIPKEKDKSPQNILNDTIMPTSFVSTQDDEDEEDDDITSYLADYDDEEDELAKESMSEIAIRVLKEINQLFDLTCFKIDSIDVSVYDENTLLIEFKGEDAALLIGKEGYRYKALSYMIFNWLNTKYQIQLRLEIAEFLKNQEESISKYLVGVCENIERDGRAQTKILDGVLVQIALKELREKYPDKYIVIRSTRDGLKYIIINDYHSN